MDVPPKPKTPAPETGFWGGLLRRSSLATRVINRGQREVRRASDGGALLRRDKEDQEPQPGASQTRRRPRRPESSVGPLEPEEDLDPVTEPEREREREPPRSRKSRGKLPAEANGHRTPSPGPLTRWPPYGLSRRADLDEQHATTFISRGVPHHQGHKRAIPHATEEYYALYATTEENRKGKTDYVDLHDSMTQLMTMRVQSRDRATRPWETLEQPSYSFYFGQLPGTITLNQWASMASAIPPTMTLRDSGVVPRTMSLERVLERLKELREGLEDDDLNLLYRILYRRILRDPDKIMNPHRTLDRQITDLIMVLSRPGSWIDFTNPRNQVVTRFIFDHGQDDYEEQYRRFFHQLLLSLELEMRIHSTLHSPASQEKLLLQIPPSIQWSMAVARRWHQNVRIDGFGETVEDVKLRYKLKKRQVKMLKRFAQMMKWPNLAATLESLRQKDEDYALDDISSDAFAFFSGLVVPGPTFPFLIMNTLIDIDPDPATDDLALLSHVHPNCGFQYRSSYTYWSASCIVGKVLAPTCHAIAGWVGPATPTNDLGRAQIARIRTRQPRQRMTPEDVQSMADRSAPLGPPAESYPVEDYVLDTSASPGHPNFEEVDTVRIEMLGLRAAALALAAGESTGGGGTPRTFDATVQFAVDGVSWPMRLTYDVSFVSAWPCSDGPHPLFFDYAYKKIRVDDITLIRDWGGLYGDPAEKERQAKGSTRRYEGESGESENEVDEEKVLVVEAIGVTDNEVLARAWCSRWGLSAVVADVRKTCMACAIREAYAATLTVVILIENQRYDDDNEDQ